MLSGRTDVAVGDFGYRKRGNHPFNRFLLPHGMPIRACRSGCPQIAEGSVPKCWTHELGGVIGSCRLQGG